jgi:hypothetical protein
VFPGDTGVCAFTFGASNLWQLGYPDRALASAGEGRALAGQLRDPFSVAFALYSAILVHWLRRDVAAQRERAAEMIAVSEAEGFPLWLGLGKAFHAAARVAEGESGAVADLIAGIMLCAEDGRQGHAPAAFALIAETYLAARQLAEARTAVETGLAVAAQTGQPFFDAELHRLQAEIVLATGGAPADAETVFHRGLDIARAQEARSFELRTATSLARLWRRESKRDAARALLAPVYAWFTEGFSTRDLIDAKALLDELT